MSLKEETVWVLLVEHFSGTMTEIIGVFTDLEAAKEVQRSYDTLTRISVTIYRTSLFTTQKARSSKDVSKPKTRVAKEKGNGPAPKKKRPNKDIAPNN